jgi:membrane-bound lytic murein transglycosylase D
MEAATLAEERMEEIRRRAKVTFLQHNVRKRETLEGLAAKYETSPAILRELNGLKEDSLRRVSRLVIPVTGLSEEENVPGKEVAPDQILMAHQRAEESRRKVRSGASASGKTEARESVRVRKGETLSSIAKKNGVSVSALARENGLSVKSKVKTGARLIIPDGGSRESKGQKKVVKRKVHGGVSQNNIARAD